MYNVYKISYLCMFIDLSSFVLFILIYLCHVFLKNAASTKKYYKIYLKVNIGLSYNYISDCVF